MKFGQVDELSDIDFTFPEISDQTKTILQGKGLLPVDLQKVKFHFGAPVFADKNYKGTLFPQTTKQKDFLTAYSNQLNSIEVNATRYGVPKMSTLEKWKESVGEDFKFSMKFPQVITHRKNIIDPSALIKLDEFIVGLDYLKEKNGIAFAVMANYFRPDQFSTLEKFVQYLPKELDFSIEFRAPEWFEGNVINEWQQLFAAYDITPVQTDTPGRRDVLSFAMTNETCFIRYVGDFSSKTDELRIENWVKRMQELSESGIDEFWFYAHEPGDKRELVVPFFNRLITEINNKFGQEITLLKDYTQTQQTLFD